MSMERFYVIHLETGDLTDILLCDQTYAVAEMVGMMQAAGFGEVAVYPKWGELAIYDAEEWVVYVGTRTITDKRG